MLILAAVIYLIMCFISNRNLFWPVTLLVRGGLGDKAISVIWGLILFAGIS